MSLVLDAFAESWGYRWYDFVSNQRLFRETDSRPIISIVCQRQLLLYGHVARYPKADPAYQVVSERDNPACDAHRNLGCGKSMPPARSQSVWEGSLHGDSRGVTARVGEATRPWRD